MKKIPLVITGSLAYDHIMTFPDKFENHILPDKTHVLNVSFNVDKLEVDRGGTAGNIAYNLALLGDKPVIYATAGQDFVPYLMKLNELDLPTDGIKILQDAKTAQAFITTDLANNQITAFHGGAMYRAHEHPLKIDKKALVIISPNGIEAMVEHAEYCRTKKLSFIFDPGQAFNALSADQLLGLVQDSVALTVNDYEWELWQNKTGLTESETLKRTQTIVITLGDKGCRVVTANETFEFPAVSGLKVVDPTGSGDAFRAGLLHGLSRGWNWRDCVKTATVTASFCVEKQGTQNHTFSKKEFDERATHLH